VNTLNTNRARPKMMILINKSFRKK